MVAPKNSPVNKPSFLSKQVRTHRYFYLRPEPSQSPDLGVICGGWEQCTTDYQMNRSRFDYYGLELVVGGQGLLTMNGLESKLMPGAVFAYAPTTPHVIRSSPKEPLVKYFINFSGKGSASLIGQNVLGNQGIAFLHDSQPVHDLYENILETGQRGGSLVARLLALQLQVLVVRIEENARSQADVHGRSRQTFERCRQILQKHYRTFNSVAELAERTHLDRAYLARLFDRYTGESPREMLTRLKMNEAAAQLFAGLSTVKEIAASVGFPDPYHFSRAFKKHFGTSPALFQLSRARLS